MEVLHHDVYREIVVDSSVIGQHGVDFDGFEHARKAHGGPHCIAKVAVFEDDGTLVVHVGSYTAKRYKQFVEVPFAGRCGLSEQFYEGQVHL